MSITKNITSINTNMKKLTILLLGIFLISLTSAVTYKFGETADIRVTCFNNGTWCSTTAECNLTLWNFEDVTVVLNQPMTNNYSFHNLTLTPTQAAYNGLYTGSAVCIDGNYKGKVPVVFEITPSGEDRDYGIFIAMILCSFGLLVFASYSKSYYLGFMTGGLFLMTGIYVLIYGIGNLANNYTEAIGFVSLGLGIIFTVASGYSAIDGDNDD